MSGTIWLITEDEYDFKVVQQIVLRKKIIVGLKWRPMTGGSGGISRLADQLERIIKSLVHEKGKQDCIAVLHDADTYRQPNRETYNEIRRICKQYKIAHITADDEMESWLLSDAGLCNWLAIKHEICDALKAPSKELERLLKKKNQHLKYQGRYRDEILKHLDGNILSPSLKEALKYLENAPCMRK